MVGDVVVSSRSCTQLIMARARVPGRRWQRVSLLLIGSLFCADCNGGDSEGTRCVSAAITGGSDHAQFLALSSAQESAICALVASDESGAPLGLCSGTLIADGVVLTAAHCVPSDGGQISLRFHVGTASDASATLIDRAFIHPKLDAALLTFPPETVPMSVRPIGPLRAPTPSVGSRVQIAGFGKSELRVLGTRQFAVTSVVDVDADSFVVSAEGRAGACEGDSGGPALVRDASGAVTLAGVLTAGAAGCAATDRYVSVAALLDWVASTGVTLGAVPVPEGDCELLGAEGQCFGAVAMWCERGAVRSEACRSEQICGHSHSADGFRCIDRAADGCAGVGSFGDCRDGERWRCSSGELERDRCTLCGATCVVSRRTGKAICNATGD